MKTVTEMIKEDLGYCCLYAFFRRFKSSTLIAARLGVTDRQVRKYLALNRSGAYTCATRANCISKKLASLPRSRKEVMPS